MTPVWQKFKEFLYIFGSISGYRPDHATLARTVVMAASFGFTLYLTKRQSTNADLALVYYFLSTAGYIGFLFLTLPLNGLRTWFLKTFGEKSGYRVYEAILAFLFFHNGAAIGYASTTARGTLGDFASSEILAPIAVALFAFGFIIKLWAAKVVGIDIYYWKDMFLGRKITDFVVSGPYRFFSNPMYGVGQLQSYGFALWHESALGLAIAVINQCAVFTFYFLAEKKFIERTYLASSSAVKSL
jgi:protein-S-isoprenylcysteine O-methyltransferase Ste14